MKEGKLFLTHYPNFMSIKTNSQTSLELDIPEKEQSWKRVDVPFELKSFFKDRSLELTIQKWKCKYPINDHSKERLDDSWLPYILGVFMCFWIPIASPEVIRYFSNFQISYFKEGMNKLMKVLKSKDDDIEVVD